MADWTAIERLSPSLCSRALHSLIQYRSAVPSCDGENVPESRCKRSLTGGSPIVIILEARRTPLLLHLSKGACRRSEGRELRRTSRSERPRSKSAPEPEIEKHAQVTHREGVHAQGEERDRRNARNERFVHIHAVDDDPRHNVEPSEEAEHPSIEDQCAKEPAASKKLYKHDTGGGEPR